MENLPISVIILTKDSKATIQECIEAVCQNSPEEIIVVDGCSSDGTMDIVKQYTSRIYYDEGKGLCYARQLGAEMAAEEYIFYADSGVVLPPNTLRTMLDEIKMKGYGALTARYRIKGATGYLGWASSRYKTAINPESPGERKATIPMRATIFPRELVLKYGFDLSTPNWDDASISYNLLKAGYKLAVSQTCVYFYHPWGRKGRGVYWGGVALAESFLKYKKSPTLLMRYTLLRGLGSPIRGLAMSLAKGDLRLIPYFVYVSLGQATGFISGLFSALLASLRGTKN